MYLTCYYFANKLKIKCYSCYLTRCFALALKNTVIKGILNLRFQQHQQFKILMMAQNCGLVTYQAMVKK